MENEYGICFHFYLTTSLIVRVHSHSNLIIFNTNGSLPRPAVGLGKIGWIQTNWRKVERNWDNFVENPVLFVLAQQTVVPGTRKWG